MAFASVDPATSFHCTFGFFCRISFSKVSTRWTSNPTGLKAFSYFECSGILSSTPDSPEVLSSPEDDFLTPFLIGSNAPILRSLKAFGSLSTDLDFLVRFDDEVLLRGNIEGRVGCISGSLFRRDAIHLSVTVSV